MDIAEQTLVLLSAMFVGEAGTCLIACRDVELFGGSVICAPAILPLYDGIGIVGLTGGLTCAVGLVLIPDLSERVD